MKNSIEKAIFTNHFKDVGDIYQRIYFGNEFCENLIPTLGLMKSWVSFAKLKNKELTFVTPFVTNLGIEKLKYLLAFLNKQKSCEVVFNDWGVFKLIRDNFINITPVLGRLLSRQRRDPRLIDIINGRQKIREVYSPKEQEKFVILPKKIPSSLANYYRTCVLGVSAFQQFILSCGINRVEIDNLVWKMRLKLNKRLKVSIYVPFGYVSTTRSCGKLTLTYKPCQKECKDYFIRLGSESLLSNVYAIGNTVFYKNAEPSVGYLKDLGIDRVIYQPRLPF
jgi:hypothetical protein